MPPVEFLVEIFKCAFSCHTLSFACPPHHPSDEYFSRAAFSRSQVPDWNLILEVFFLLSALYLSHVFSILWYILASNTLRFMVQNPEDSVFKKVNNF
jgi:hypothetical protein